MSPAVQHPWPLKMLRTLQFGVARLMSRGGYVEARSRAFDLTFTGPARDVITRHIYRYGVHEPHITRYLIDHVRLAANEVALDVGANLGWYSVLLDRLSEPGARVFAFEPDPHSFELLELNLRRNATRQVTAVNIALGECEGTAQLHRYKLSNNGRHTLLEGATSGGTVEVPVRTLESFWHAQQLGARPIRFMKVDVEGFEYFVLKGAGELLRRCQCIVLEYSPESLRIAGLEAQAVLKIIRKFNFAVQAFADGALVPLGPADLAQAGAQRDLLLTPESSAGARA
jgi:FkbM family methyltransferase